jgi:hypothetical protein
LQFINNTDSDPKNIVLTINKFIYDHHLNDNQLILFLLQNIIITQKNKHDIFNIFIFSTIFESAVVSKYFVVNKKRLDSNKWPRLESIRTLDA